MTCYYPKQGYKLQNGQISFADKGNTVTQMTIPCGGCHGCRLERSRHWAVRCTHEAQMHKQNSFLTLTLDAEKFENGICPVSLDKTHLQKFFRTLRDDGLNIRYYASGEYGEAYGRPHYHAILFGYKPTDLKTPYKSDAGCTVYESEEMAKYWKKGKVFVGDVTFESAAYVARYVMKKVTGTMADDRYQSCNPYTGELTPIEPEFALMSRKPLIGKSFYDKYMTDIYPHGTVIHNGQKLQPPRAYERLYKKSHPAEYEEIQFAREQKRKYEDMTYRRLEDRATVAKAQMSFKKRSFG